ncbi:MAG: RDD family protein [Deltaproteobacteria bacterium]|nr:RDD family protein [Deltaproteobacteria bacterium]
MIANSTAPMEPRPAPTMKIQSEPGGFLRRFGAAIIDSTICYVIRFSMLGPLGLVLGMIKANSFYNTTQNRAALLVLIYFIVPFAVCYFYFGYFYHNKGASPGKMLFGLKVIRDEDGTHLSYGRAFWRETVGKAISIMPMGIGFLWALARPDRKTFHDLMFKTQVLHQKK